MKPSCIFSGPRIGSIWGSVELKDMGALFGTLLPLIALEPSDEGCVWPSCCGYGQNGISV